MTKMIVPHEQGSFLIEVTIGGALIAGLGMAGASFYKTRRQTQDYLDKLRELNTFHSSLNKFLQNSANCNATFNTWRESSSVPGVASDDIKRIIRCNSSTYCTESSTAKSIYNAPSSVKDVILTEAVAKFPNDDKYWLPISINNPNKRTRSWRVKDFGMAPMNRTGKGTLEILYELYPGRPDTRIVKKSIALNFKFDKNSTPRFISCASDKESSLRSVLEEMCETFNKTLVGAGSVAAWDYASQTCVLRNTSPCGNTIGITGVTTNGTLGCGSYTTGIQGSSIYNADDNNCAGNKKPSIHVGSDGQLRIICD